ncbi:MAG: PH domain-containing protein [Candidatus Heimdallarchaeota archaeon]|nr:PH domain-containing protein [Candidatus Heimdallarchaeota archaeon]MDH5647075.1 PH domain-containing protein [Candidatus Heimdallarchaeota archaeon]
MSVERFTSFYPSTQLRKKFLIGSSIPIFVFAIPLLFTIIIINIEYMINNQDSKFIDISGGILFALGFLILIYLIFAMFYLLYYKTIRYEIKENEIHVFRGLITKSHKIVPFRTITNMDLKRGILDRLFSIGSIEIQTAGSGSAFLPEERLDGILLADIEPLREHILNKVRLITGGSAGVTHDNDQYSDVYVLQQILDELRLLRVDLTQKRKNND